MAEYEIKQTGRSVTWTLSEDAFRRVHQALKNSVDIPIHCEEWLLCLRIMKALNGNADS